MFVAFGELTPLSWGLIGFAILFFLQLLLCVRVQNKLVKCIPLFLILFGFLLSGAVYFGVFGSYSAGAISGNGLVALIFAFVVGIAAGVLLAWCAYGGVRLLKRDKRR